MESVRYEKHKKLAESTTSVWFHFLKGTDNESAKCMKCNKVIKTKGGTTTGLHTHLKSAHCIDLKNSSQTPTTTTSRASASASVTCNSSISNSTIADTDNDKSFPKKRKMTDYFASSTSLVETICRLTALDGMPFRIFENSTDLRRMMTQCGYKIPKSSNQIKNIVISHRKSIKMALIEKLRILKTDNFKLSITLDEWTSSGNKRYMNLNIHHCVSSVGGNFVNKFHNLGLIRIHGSMPASTCVKLLEERLATFDLSLKEDIVCLTTDGASVMNAVGRQAALYHQKCMAHGIQLAVLDVLYKRENVSQELSRERPQLLVNEEPISDPDPEEIDDNDGFNVSLRRDNSGGEEFIFQDTIEKVRKIIKMFRKSPTKNDAILQNYVQEEFGRELNLILDCRTRWSSLALMLERFIKLKTPVRKALIDLKTETNITNEEFERLEEISKLLEVVKATVEELCKRSCNLVIADSAMTFMLTKLEDIITFNDNNFVGRDLVTALKRRIKERRLLVAGTLNYLHNPQAYFQSNPDNTYSDVFPRPSAEIIREHVKDLNRLELGVLGGMGQRDTNTSPSILTQQESNEIHDSSVSDNSNQIEAVEVDPEQEMTFKKQLSLAIQNTIRVQAAPVEAEDEETLIKIEMALFENGGLRGKYLQKAYDRLITIPPTSVESERVFSSAKYMCNHLRSRLSDETMDTLSFLRSHYLNSNAATNK